MGKHEYQPVDLYVDGSAKSSMEAEEKDSLLLPSDGDVPRRRRPRSRLCKMLLCLTAMFLFISYSILLVGITFLIMRKARMYGTRFLKSPANDFIMYESRVMDQWEWSDDKTYFTKPSPQVDQNWHELFEYQNIGVQPELMSEMGRTEEGIKLPDDTYFGSLMVFHHLHCLKNIYHALNPEYYHLDRMTAEERDKHQEHTEHCLHMLKDAVMCQGDTTLVTMKWAEYGLRPIGNLTSPHECVNWDRLMEWVVPNSRDVFANGALIHPTRGPVFIDGQFAPGATV